MCVEKAVCTSANKQELQKCLRDKFQHQWLNGEASFCESSVHWWLIYEEGPGTFCLLCKVHNVLTSGKNHYVTGGKRLKKKAVEEHAKTENHKKAITTEMMKRVSVFNKEATQKEKVGENVQRKAFLAAYWLMKEEASN